VIVELLDDVDAAEAFRWVFAAAILYTYACERL